MARASAAKAQRAGRLRSRRPAYARLVKVIRPIYQFDDPAAMLVDGAHVFVANAPGDSVSEIEASGGALVRVFSGLEYGFDDPDALVADGPDVFVGRR